MFLDCTAWPRQLMPPPLAPCRSADDHLDVATLKHIYKVQPKGSVKFFAPLGNQKWFKSIGIPNDDALEMDWWDERDLAVTLPVREGDGGGERGVAHVRLTCTPCQHFTGRTPFDVSALPRCSWRDGGATEMTWLNSPVIWRFVAVRHAVGVVGAHDAAVRGRTREQGVHLVRRRHWVSHPLCSSVLAHPSYQVLTILPFGLQVPRRSVLCCTRLTPPPLPPPPSPPADPIILPPLFPSPARHDGRIKATDLPCLQGDVSTDAPDR